ncbi:hypothetical protein FQN54_009463 [Arachnomyces sp. PD_36]|nr:hypothetical protein FQN54_009463 [Arachnomyces sp. PD_36]
MAVGYAKDQPEGFTNRIERVAIVGAGGSIGKHITEHLLKTGKHVVTAITRPSSTNKLPDGAQVLRVDYNSDDDTAIVEALRGQQALLITLSVTAPRDTIIKLIRAAAKAGVPYIQPNWWGHDPTKHAMTNDVGFTEARERIIAEIEGLGVSSYFFLACNFWYEFSLGGGLDRYGFDFEKRSFIQFNDAKDIAINTSTWPQCGRAIANLLSLKELPDDENDKSLTLSQFRNSPVYISSFKITQLDMFESVKRVTGTTDADWNISHGNVQQRFKEGKEALAGGDFAGFVRLLYSRMFFPNGDGEFEDKLHNEVLGLPVENLDEATAIGIRMGENWEVPYSH